MHAPFQQLIAALADRTGLTTLEILPDNSCTLFFDDLPLTLQYLPENDCLLLFSSLGKLPDKGREAFCLKLLEANHFFNDTAGATLSAHAGSGLVGLHQVVPMRMLDEAQFLQLLETYMNTAERWARACTGSDARKAAPDTENMPGVGWMQA